MLHPKALCLALLSALAASPAHSAPPVDLTKPGKYVILHADDLGMTHSMNQATFEALDQKIVSSTSVMPTTPWLPEVAAYAKSHSDVDLGIHLTLNSEWEGVRWRPL